jgi:GNAT superfamily N-acetyltransferase
MTVSVVRLVAREVEPYLPELARLRLTVFREWPYLYDGDLAHEERYLQSYMAEAAMVAIACDGPRVVGACSALPATSHADIALPDLASVGVKAEHVYYFGESVLEAAYRGRGIGHRFFDVREAFARELGFEWAMFGAVERPAEHPRRPAHYVPHDVFWRKRGFARRDELVAPLSWKDLDDPVESEKPMVFWLKALNAAEP